MQKINIFIFLVGVLCLSACKKNKDDSNSADAISASIDGTATTFNFGAHASAISVSGGYGINIYGNKKDPSTSQTSLSISIVSPNPIVAGTYVESANGNPLISMSYDYDFVFSIMYSYKTFGSSTHPLSIAITGINSGFVKGTFSGEVEGTAVATGAPVKYLVTNGKFNVKF